MNFSHHYDKLDNVIYTTIRKNLKPNHKVGNIEKIFCKGRLLHNAKILMIEKCKLSQIPTSFLLMDCMNLDISVNNREDCYHLFQTFYKKMIDFSTQEFYILLMVNFGGGI